MGFACPTCGKVMATEGGLEVHLGRAHRAPGAELGPFRLPRALVVAQGVGTGLVGLGFFLFLFASYQLWGTDLVTGWHQRSLKGADPPALPAAGGPGLPLPAGDSVAVLWIPRIDLELGVVEGVGVADLKRGPGHYPGTPLPGEPGNAAIAGHRTTYGAPFSRLDELVPGDALLLSTHGGTSRYEVSDIRVVRPSQREVLAPTPDSRLTLTTCHPRYSAAQRLIVVARLVAATPSDPSSQGPAPPPPGARRAAPAAGLSGERAAAWPTLGFGAGLAAALVATRAWARRRGSRRPWVLAAPGLAVLLLLFFENFDRLLPGNI